MNGKYDCRISLNMYLDQVSVLSERCPGHVFGPQNAVFMIFRNFLVI